MNFASDNWAGVTPEVMAALASANGGAAPAYGGDDATERLSRQFADLFEHEVDVWFTATGTASNSLSLAAISRPGGLILCGAEAHAQTDEWGATELQSPGTKLVTVPQTAGRISATDLTSTLARFPEGNRYGNLAGLTLTNATEAGTVYSPEMTAELAGLAKAQGIPVHLDGARFANAVAATGASPADLTWKAGIDLMSFGGTKNGCMFAEAILVFTPDRVSDLFARRQRAGQTLSKARFIAAQFEAYLEGGNWLRWAGHANAMSARLRAGLRQRSGARLAWESEANEVFAILDREALARFRAKGGSAHEWPADGLPPEAQPAASETLVRLVTSWATTEAEVDGLLSYF